MATEVLTGELVRAPEPLLPMAVDQAEQAMVAYQQLTGRLLVAEDWQGPPGQQGSFVKRRGWSKLSTFYGLSTQIVSETVERDEDGNPVRARFVVRATHPNGRYEEGDGACSINEPRFAHPKGRLKAEHDIAGTARTRARNRAIADLIGFGAVSAEEIDADTATAVATSDVKPWPGWAQPVPDVGKAARLLTGILVWGGVQDAADRVNQIGQTLMDTCNGTIPVAVQVALEQITEALDAGTARAPASPAPEPDAPAASE